MTLTNTVGESKITNILFDVMKSTYLSSFVVLPEWRLSVLEPLLLVVELVLLAVELVLLLVELVLLAVELVLLVVELVLRF